MVLICALFAGCAGNGPISGNTVLMKINGHEINAEEYRTYYLALKNKADSGVSSYWESNANQKETLKTNTLTQLQSKYAAEEILDENSITLNDADLKNVQTLMDKTQSGYGSAESYQQALKDNFYTEETYRSAVELAQRENRYLYQTKKDEIQTNFVRAKHILIKFDSTADDEAADKAAKLKKAQEVDALAKGGTDFDDLIKQYGEDPGMQSSPEGYYFTTGQMVESFEKAAFALKENEISDPVESKYGYHIILRLPMEEQYLIDNLSTLLSNGTEYYSDFSAKISEKVAAQKVEYTDAYKRVDINTVA